MSEFGKGLSYNIGLFLCHAFFSEDSTSGVWFNGASDHLYELNIPENFPEELRIRIKTFQEKVLSFGHGNNMFKSTIADKNDTLEEAKNILMEIDKFIGVDAEKADWD